MNLVGKNQAEIPTKKRKNEFSREKSSENTLLKVRKNEFSREKPSGNTLLKARKYEFSRKKPDGNTLLKEKKANLVGKIYSWFHLVATK